MKERMSQREQKSRTLDANLKASNQAPISKILQTYSNKTLGRYPNSKTVFQLMPEYKQVTGITHLVGLNEDGSLYNGSEYEDNEYCEVSEGDILLIENEFFYFLEEVQIRKFIMKKIETAHKSINGFKF